MIRAVLVSLCLMWPSLLVAQDWPALFRVMGVSSDDVLTTRNAASAAAPVVGAFRSDQTGIEVIAPSADGKWGLVNHEEGTAWVLLRYLARVSAPDEFPNAVFCGGTEPFWSLDIKSVPAGLTAEFSSPEQPSLRSRLQNWMRSANRVDRFSALGSAETGKPVVVAVSRQSCSDGMSDRSYGLTVDLLMTLNSEPVHLSGCCSLSP